VGVEVFPLFHDRDFDAELNRLLPALEKVPVTFHEPYYQADHTAPEGSEVCERTDEMFQKTVHAAEKLKARHIVFHHNNCWVPDSRLSSAQQ
jgi:sugar phosphate isomerase/epimerase